MKKLLDILIHDAYYLITIQQDATRCNNYILYKMEINMSEMLEEITRANCGKMLKKIREKKQTLSHWSS